MIKEIVVKVGERNFNDTAEPTDINDKWQVRNIFRIPRELIGKHVNKYWIKWGNNISQEVG